jgi:hypothetical protein
MSFLRSERGGREDLSLDRKDCLLDVDVVVTEASDMASLVLLLRWNEEDDVGC